MRSILAVSDLTPASDRALSAAAVLAIRSGAGLHVVHPMEIVGMTLRDALQADVGRRIEDAKSALARQVRRVVPAGLAPASCALGFNQAGDTVRVRAREVGADLVVLGAGDPDTPGGVRHLRALHDAAGAAAAPCLLVRNPLNRPFIRVLLPLSAAEVGQGVLAHACDWLSSLDPPTPTELRVLHVTSGPREWRELAPELDRELRRAGGQRPWRARLRIRRSIRWNTVPHTEILRVAAEETPDLVMLGPAGGVASSAGCPEDARAILLHRLPCSVLVLPGTLAPWPDTDGAGAPASSTDPEMPTREAVEPEATMELAAAGD
ncbi:universal stress protein [Longimicrobium sp.]|uniref:universal stress protein n=1 Tax=Longimicrobium sp. TaxID=2029185 RepID=UPI002C5B3AB9|nr:universal stress protein [Longimicrobium sp.]HSU16151.1 universal stress protein [Longimicrobium sp.]